ncbi:MAG: hypothetical protein JWM05_2730 [Acidimicrobiales bacterium]|nr:hypothetical protein [Acidimicrobiales bacterium]
MALAATALFTVSPQASGAYTSACKISELPALQASQSAGNFTCKFTQAAGSANEVSSKFSFHDFADVTYHQGSARPVKVSSAAASGATVLTAATGHFNATYDVNHPISGLGIAPYTFVKAVTATTVTLNKPTNAAIPVNTVLLFENTNTRAVTDAVNGNATTALTSASANFNAADAGKSIRGANIKPGTTVASVTNPTTVVLSQTQTACGAAPQATCSPQNVTISASAPVTTARVITGTNTATVITSASAGFSTPDIGQYVNGSSTVYIASVTSTTATVTGGTLAANGVAHTIPIGQPSATAPTNGSAAVNLASALTLDPTFSSGAPSCASHTPVGFGVVGAWFNPGSFQTGGLISAPPTGKVIAQIVFTTLVPFSAYIVQQPSDAANASPHYDLTFPSLPLTIAMCPSPSTSGVLASVTIMGATINQIANKPGIGVPGSGQIRYINPASAAVTGLTAQVSDGDAAGATHTVWGPITKTCTIPAPGTPAVLPGAAGSCETP